MAEDHTWIDVTDRSGTSVKLHYVDGIYYPSYVMGPDNYRKRLDAVKGMEIYSDDIVSVGFLRSGNHWVNEIVHMLTSNSTEFHQKHMIRDSLIDCFSDERMEEFSKTPAPRQIHAHFWLSQLSPQLPQIKPKVVYTIRSPKDVYVSLYNFAREVKGGITYSGTFDDFLDLALTGKFIYGSWFDHTLAMEKFIEEHPECPVHVVCYEKLKEDPVGEIKRLAQYLNTPDELAEKIAEVTTFSKMKQNLPDILKAKGTVEDGKSIQDIFKEGASGLYRKGEVGDWRNWFKEAENERFNQVFDTKMANSKLAQLVRPYIV